MSRPHSTPPLIRAEMVSRDRLRGASLRLDESLPQAGPLTILQHSAHRSRLIRGTAFRYHWTHSSSLPDLRRRHEMTAPRAPLPPTAASDEAERWVQTSNARKVVD